MKDFYLFIFVFVTRDSNTTDKHEALAWVGCDERKPEYPEKTLEIGFRSIETQHTCSICSKGGTRG